ncbi:trigger factor family protein [bacterium]|nr:trigger factor family protein [bacterium]
MKHTLKKGKASNYEVEIIFTPEDQSKVKQHVLLTFQKDMEKPGYRKGHVPLDIVEKNVDPQYFEMAVTEHIINHALQHILAENSDIKFIGEPYGYNQNKKDDETIVTIFLDVYPEVEIKKDDWKKEAIKPISTKVEEKEIDEALHNLKKNYADYQDTDKLEKDTVSKI